MSNVWRSSSSRPPVPQKTSSSALKEFDPTRGFCCGDLITFSGATVCRTLDGDSSPYNFGRPYGDKDLSNEPAKFGIWLGMTTYAERPGEWDPMEGWINLGVCNAHLFHMVLTAQDNIVFVLESPERRPGMKLVSAVAV